MFQQTKKKITYNLNHTNDYDENQNKSLFLHDKELYWWDLIEKL